MIYGLLRIANSPNPFAVLDDVYYNKKIKCFDTANCYGFSETIFGEWITQRGINRHDISIICKGGHHANNGPHIIHRINTNSIVQDLVESFQRLKIKYADCFMFHRDDVNVSPEQVYEICNYLLESKLCNKIGVSNWSTSRIEVVNRVSNLLKGRPIIEESQIFLHYIKCSNVPYPNIHMIDYSDYKWYLNHPEHKIQIYSVACFINELENNPVHPNKIFKTLLDYICNLTNENRQTILYVLLSKCTGLNVECIHGSINPNHILNQSKIDEIFLPISNKIPNILEILPGFLVEHPVETPVNSISSFLMNGVVGPFQLQDVDETQIDSIATWVLNQHFTDYTETKFHHENNMNIMELCTNKTLHDIVSKYIGYECVCYNTELFIRQNNDDFTYTSNWHIDPYLNIDECYPHFTIQIGFTDNNENNSLSAIVGSHLFDYQKNYNTINTKNNFAPIVNYDEKNLDSSLIYNLLNKKGSVYLFSNYLTHGKGTILNNDTNNARVALTLRIISKESMIKSLEDHWHISKRIFTLGSNETQENQCSELLWNIVQTTYKGLFLNKYGFWR